jgi:hypothetical protein
VQIVGLDSVTVLWFVCKLFVFGDFFLSAVLS